ncbi:RAMP superfamily CRISPR-associated protein [Actinomyces sp. HMSC075C01]|uniref:RAMP superfamily CRISPR-associated protein n=1 Tax=Actinomyces sp. HMSC075C01 TaxID=1739387 RepID=UPI000AB795BD|nr:RAMP superfamily CRISPR-associated protein [Actinomyces sp. HMSC075C01]
MSPSSPTSFLLSVTFHSDWGVTTGTGVAGGVDSVVEKDERGLPIVRATVLAGVVREQSLLAAQALDDGSGRSWRAFASALFGSDLAPRLVTFSDARLIDPPADPTDLIHEVISLSIDERTGTAREDFLRIFERAGACRLRGEVTLSDVDRDGRPLTWSDEQRDAAELLLALSGLLVRAIGSNRAVGDGVCDVLIHADHEPGDTRAVKDWCRTQLGRWKGRGAPQVPAADATAAAAPVLKASPAPTAAGTFHEATLTVDLRTPVVSYQVPMSNEIRSLDFLRGTVLLPWVHRLITRTVAQAPGAPEALVQEVRDAVVNGELLVSDGVVSYQGERGLPMPLVLSSPKVGQGAESQEPKTAEGEGDGEMRVCNRMRAEEPEHEVHKPLRNGYVFPAAGARGAPALIGRQSTAHDAATGAARDGQLYLVRALPAGLSLQATVTVSTRLYQRIGEQLEALAGTGHRARLGARRLSGTFGETECTLSAFAPSPAPPSSSPRRTGRASTPESGTGAWTPGPRRATSPGPPAWPSRPARSSR